MDVRVRFAPSPTGQVHIGNIRTAIFNWLFARHNNGKFLLRVEDTDLERSNDAAKAALMECMEWLGLDYDEAPLYQSSRSSAHAEAAQRLLDAGMAYKPVSKSDESVPVLFRLPLDTDNIPDVRTLGAVEIALHADVPVKVAASGVEFAQVSRKGKAMPFAGSLAGFTALQVFDLNGTCIFDLTEKLDDVLSGKIFSLENCSKIGFIRKEVVLQDLIKGELAKPLDGMKDLVIVRSDGSPVFHLANVCDDAEQGITHIIRGDDHVENSYRHILLFRALGYELPEYAHLPMIVNHAGKPLSKRDGDAYVGDFRRQGYLADGLFNYLTLLGWSPGDGREKMARQEIVDAFSLERVKSAPAQMDSAKLLNMNGLYITEMQSQDFAEYAWEYFSANGEAEGIDYAYFVRVALIMQIRTKLISQMESWNYFFSDDFCYTLKVARKVFRKEEIRQGLDILNSLFVSLEEFLPQTIEGAVRVAEDRVGLGDGKLNQALRLALTGVTGGADLYETAMLLGVDKVIKRINRALSMDFESSEA